jgi:transposase InsO family protein
LLTKHKLVASMSRKGNCWDNAVTERFFLNLKMERVWQRRYANHGEAMADINHSSSASTKFIRCTPAMDTDHLSSTRKKLPEIPCLGVH